MIRCKNKVFIDVHEATHLQPIEGHPEGPYLAYFAQLFALKNQSAADLIYGSQPGSLSNSGLSSFQVASGADENMGGNFTVGFLACRESGESNPPELAHFCYD